MSSLGNLVEPADKLASVCRKAAAWPAASCKLRFAPSAASFDFRLSTAEFRASSFESRASKLDANSSPRLAGCSTQDHRHASLMQLSGGMRATNALSAASNGIGRPSLTAPQHDKKKRPEIKLLIKDQLALLFCLQCASRCSRATFDFRLSSRDLVVLRPACTLDSSPTLDANGFRAAEFCSKPV